MQKQWSLYISNRHCKKKKTLTTFIAFTFRPTYTYLVETSGPFPLPSFLIFVSGLLFSQNFSFY